MAPCLGLLVLSIILLPVNGDEETSSYQLEATCFSLIKDKPKMDECLKCFQEIPKDNSGEELSEDEISCLSLLPRKFQECKESQEQRTCLQNTMRDFVEITLAVTWKNWIHRVSEEEKGYAVQQISMVLLLHKIARDNEDEYLKIHDAIKPCIEQMQLKLKKRETDPKLEVSEHEDEVRIVRTREFITEEDELREAEMMKEKYQKIYEYLTCKIQKMKENPSVWAFIKEYLLSYANNVPAALTAEIIKDCNN